MALIKKATELTISSTIKMMVYGQAGMGKAQPLFCGVLTPEGHKPMGEIKVGDTVMSSDGRVQNVIGVYPQGKRPYYKVVTNDGAETYCDIDHIWNVRNSNGNSRKAGWRNMTTRQMLEKGIICPQTPRETVTGRSATPRYEIPVCGAIQYSEKEFSVDPYILGVLIGDGSLVGSVALFGNPDIDKEISEEVERRLPEGYSLTKRTEPACPQYLITVANREKGRGYIRKIDKLGLCVHSSDKFIPKEYLYGSVTQRYDLLRGLMDTDGSADDNRVAFHTTSPKLANDVVTLVRSLGGIAKVFYYEREDKDCCEYRVNVKTPDCPFMLARKAAEWAPANISRYIVSMTYMGETETQCIKVDGQEELYVTDDFIVTHNTTLALSAPKPLLLDFDGGVKRINLAHLDGVDTVQVSSWQDVQDVLREDLSAYETIVVDTVGKLMDFVITYKCGKRQPRIQDWGAINQEFSWFTRALGDLNKNVVFVAHRDSRKEGDDTVFIPSLREKNYNAIVTELDLLGYLEMRLDNGVVRRTITFDPTNRNDGKNTCNLPPVMAVPTIVNSKGEPTAPNNFITEAVIKPYEAMLAKKSEEAGRYAAVVAEISEAIELITDADGANSFASNIDAFAHVGSSKAKARTLFLAKVESLGLVFDKTSKKYKDAGAA